MDAEEAVKQVTSIIYNSGFDLVHGRAETVARVIVGRLAALKPGVEVEPEYGPLFDPGNILGNRGHLSERDAWLLTLIRRQLNEMHIDRTSTVEHLEPSPPAEHVHPSVGALVKALMDVVQECQPVVPRPSSNDKQRTP